MIIVPFAFISNSYSLSKRVEDIEHISGAINKKITVVLNILEDMESGESKKKERMSKAMDSFVEGHELEDPDDDKTVYMDDDEMDNMDDMDDM